MNIALSIKTQHSIEIGKCLQKSVKLSNTTKFIVISQVTTAKQFPLKVGDS